MLLEVLQAREGMRNLQTTYEDDPLTVAQMQVLLDNIDTRLEPYRRDRPEFFEGEARPKSSGCCCCKNCVGGAPSADYFFFVFKECPRTRTFCRQNLRGDTCAATRTCTARRPTAVRLPSATKQAEEKERRRSGARRRRRCWRASAPRSWSSCCRSGREAACLRGGTRDFVVPGTTRSSTWTDQSSGSTGRDVLTCRFSGGNDCALAPAPKVAGGRLVVCMRSHEVTTNRQTRSADEGMTYFASARTAEALANGKLKNRRAGPKKKYIQFLHLHHTIFRQHACRTAHLSRHARRQGILQVQRPGPARRGEPVGGA